MDPSLIKRIRKELPKFNDRICNGIATEHMRDAEIMLDNVWKNAIAPLANMGLTYVGYSRCTPQEAFEFAPSRSTKGKRYLEMEKTEMYLVKYFLRLNGEDMPPIYLYVPYARPGGLITIKGSTFGIAPVLIDKAISIGTDQIFVNVGKDRFSFMRYIHYFIQNGVRQSEYVVWANIHHAKRSSKSKGNGPYRHVSMDATPVLYLMCKHGLTGAMKKYGKCNIVVGQHDINVQTYPPDKWTIFESTGSCPNTLKGARNRALYKPSEIRVAIKNSEITPRVVSMMAGVYYNIDHFSELVSVDEVDNTDLWKLILGHITFCSDTIVSKLLQDIDTHINSLDTYIDSMVRQNLKNGGVDVKDIYDLFVYMIDNLPEKISQGAGSINTLYGKQLSVLPYVLNSVIKAIFTFSFSLRPGIQREITYKEVENVMKRLKPRIAREMNSGNPAVTSVSSAGDNLIFKITSVMVQQSNSTGGRKRSNSHIDASKLLNASLAEVASWNHLPKSSPSGYERLNPCVLIGPDSTILRNPRYKALIDETQALIQR